MRSKILLYGPPASGKSTLGKALAEALKVPFVDLDGAIEAKAGKPIKQIFAESGEPAFRDLESAALAEVCAGDERKVISLGGGTLLREANRKLAEEAGSVICLEAPSAEVLAERIAAGGDSRPLGNKAKERAPHYASFAKRIARYFLLEGSTVVVGEHLFGALVQGEKLVVDGNVAKIWSGKPEGLSTTGWPGDNTIIFTQPSGEEYKTPAQVMAMWHAFAQVGLGRKDRVVAVGGGVTGDMTGFAAATWMRGISWINVPTTLLSMVDASTGGKTGCDLPEGKNLAGAFHSPKLVIIDTDFLTTLPPEVLKCGRAEMIKHAAIGGKGARSKEQGASADGVPSAAEIAANLAVKVGVVREDPFETKGRRIMLNCGHTIGHAVEKASNYRLSHGEAVAIGCVEEARLAVKLGLTDEKWVAELAAAFKAAGLPTENPYDYKLLIELMKGDKKKSSGSTVTFTPPCGWGDVRAVKIDLAGGWPL